MFFRHVNITSPFVGYEKTDLAIARTLDLKMYRHLHILKGCIDRLKNVLISLGECKSWEGLFL